MAVSVLSDDKRSTTPVGLHFLIETCGVKVPMPSVRSEVLAGARRTRLEGGKVLEQYPPQYLPRDLKGHLRFAMKHEPVDLAALAAIFRAVGPKPIEEWVRAEPTGAFSRRCWYLYEFLSGEVLDAPDIDRGAYVSALDPDLHVTSAPVRVRRQRINDNLLATPGYGMLIRRTPALRAAMSAGVEGGLREVMQSCEPGILARAVHYLFTQETKSSFAIEGEAPSKDRTERFVQALQRAEDFDASDKEAFVRLQNIIVDPRYAHDGWRNDQNYIGRTLPDYSQKVYYVCPKPQDVPGLMDGWMRLARRLASPGNVDPVCAAAAVAFSFVYIHPFDDGNGRIHRFLVHHVLARTGFAPPGLLLPVSAAMLRDRDAYDRVLETVSGPLLQFIDYTVNPDHSLTVANETACLYRYFDATEHAEYLWCCVEDALRRDLKDEIGFLKMFDSAVHATLEIVDMPDRRASLLVKLILQNNGTLSAAKRPHFAELTDQEVQTIEGAVRARREAGG